MSCRKAIIGGTGMERLETLHPDWPSEERIVNTEFGTVAVQVLRASLAEGGEQEIVFLSRHGGNHSVPPHRINYHANLAALAALEVDEIYASCAVGSMNPNYDVGEVVLITGFLDFTKTRAHTFYDGEDGTVRHAAMDSPYCPRLTQRFRKRAKSFEIDVKGNAVYVCTEGPRFETAEEIRMFQILGGDVVGMTGVPECVLAKELGMCYASVGIISNWATGVQGGGGMHDIAAAVQKNRDRVTEAMIQLLCEGETAQETEADCSCADSMILL